MIIHKPSYSMPKTIYQKLIDSIEPQLSEVIPNHGNTVNNVNSATRKSVQCYFFLIVTQIESLYILHIFIVFLFYQNLNNYSNKSYWYDLFE